MGKIEYTTASGMRHEISDNFKFNAMGYIWSLFVAEKDLKIKTILDEIHGVLSAVLYGTIDKEG